MQKTNYGLACAVVLLGLCLASSISACASSREVSTSVAGTSLGVLVDEEARVLDLFEDRSYFIATELGIEVGDVVLSINGEPIVLNVEAIIQQGHKLSTAAEAKVKVLRDGEEIDLTYSLIERSKEVEAAAVELNQMFEGRTDAEIDQMFEENFEPGTVPPTTTPVPQNTYGL